MRIGSFPVTDYSGDSYSATHYNVTLDRPNDENILGNPTFPGHTSCNGTNWVYEFPLSQGDGRSVTSVVDIINRNC